MAGNVVKSGKIMRDPVIDIGKGIGIFFVIWGHTVCVVNDYIYSFHIPFFFIVSGYFHSCLAEYGEFFVKNFKRIIYPYLGYSLFAYVFYALWFAIVLRGQRFEYESILNIFAVRETVIAPLWFLVSLFTVTMLYDLIRRAAVGNMLIILICMLLTLIGYYTSLVRNDGFVNYFHLFSSLSMMFFYSVGAQLKVSGVTLYLKDKKISVILTVVVLAVFMVTSRYSFGMDINTNRINAPFVIYLTNAFLGSFLVMSTAAMLYQVALIRKALVYVGERSLAVFALHFPMFEISRPFAGMVFEKNTYMWGFALSVLCLLASLWCAYVVDIVMERVKKTEFSL